MGGGGVDSSNGGKILKWEGVDTPLWTLALYSCTIGQI